MVTRPRTSPPTCTNPRGSTAGDDLAGTSSAGPARDRRATPSLGPADEYVVRGPSRVPAPDHSRSGTQPARGARVQRVEDPIRNRADAVRGEVAVDGWAGTGRSDRVSRPAHRGPLHRTGDERRRASGTRPQGRAVRTLRTGAKA